MKATEWKLGMSSCSTGRPDKETFDGYAKGGIDCMEVSFGYKYHNEVNWDEVLRLSKDSGVKLWSFHIPFYPFEEVDITSADKAVRKATVDMCEKYFNICEKLGIRVAVIHPSAEPNEDSRRAELLKTGADTLANLAEIAEKYGVTVAAEDLPRTCLGNCSSDIKELISLNDKLRVCFDTNHLLIEKNTDFVKAVGDRIITLHVSDYDFLNERHWLPYEGKQDWIALVTALEEAGYCGPFMYEIELKTPDTITRRDLTFADFVENYKACIEKRPYATFGVPNTEVCMNNAYFKEPVI